MTHAPLQPFELKGAQLVLAGSLDRFQISGGGGSEGHLAKTISTPSRGGYEGDEADAASHPSIDHSGTTLVFLVRCDRPRSTATICPFSLVTVTSYTPVRPTSTTSLASAVSSSPSMAGATKSTTIPAAKVSSLLLLQAKANAESASQGDEAAVTDLEAVQHVRPHAHGQAGVPRPHRLDPHSEPA